jgi:hypothetical protein
MPRPGLPWVRVLRTDVPQRCQRSERDCSVLLESALLESALLENVLLESELLENALRRNAARPPRRGGARPEQCTARGV